MKRKSMFFVAMMSLMITVTGCGKASTTGADDQKGAVTTPSVEKSVVNEGKEEVTKEVEKEEVVPEITSESVESDWVAGEDKRQKFNVNFLAYHTKDFGLTVGMSGEIHYTNDGGESWPQATNKSKCCFGLDFVNDKVIYACGNGKNVVKSTDGGQNFSRVADFGGDSPNQCKMLSFYDENNGIIASAKLMAITHDGGTSWKELTLPCKVAGINMNSENRIYFVGDDFNMYISEDGGETWNSTALNLPEKNDYYNIPQSFAFSIDENGYTLFASQKSTKLVKRYVTVDQGATWTEEPLPEVEGHYYLYLNKDGDVLTANNGLKMTSTVLTRK